MKAFITLALVAVTLVACGAPKTTSNNGTSTFASSSSHRTHPYTLDMRSPFQNTEINMMDDGMEDVDGLKVLVPAAPSAVSVSIKMDGGGSCKLLSKTPNAGGAALLFETTPDVDDGTCIVTISLANGLKAELRISAVGT